MARIFIIKASKGKGDFFMTEPSEFLYFYSPTLKDLRATLRCITSKGYRLPKEATISKRIKSYNGHLTLLNPFFQTTMFEIFEIRETLTVKKELEYENSFCFKHNLKIVDSDSTEKLFKMLYPDKL
jgi:hypothetical protein